MSIDVIPHVSISPSKIVLYNQFLGLPYSPRESNSWKDNFKSNLTQGQISKSAESKIRLAIDWLIFLSPYKKVYLKKEKKSFRFKVNFITLTLPSAQVHDDVFIKRNMLNHFLQILRYKHKMKFYVWRAEAQVNGNIHFHITTNVFVEYWLVKKYWNKILDKHGYIKHYSRNQKKFFANGFTLSKNEWDYRTFRQQYKSYIWNSLIDWQCPNSTDIHSVKNIKKLGAYLAKYFTKNSTDRPIDGRLWYVSSELSKLKSSIDVIDQRLSLEINFLLRKFSDNHKGFEYADILYLDYAQWKSLDVPELKKLFKSYFNDVLFNQEFKI